MLRRTILTALAAAAVLSGQEHAGSTAIGAYLMPVEAFVELKQYLTLADAQVEQLRRILDEKNAATQEIYKQIEAKQIELNGLLKSGSRDALRIGQLTIDIHALVTQTPPPADRWRQAALAVLTAEQRVKLDPLDQAMKLSATGYQAVTLNLLDPPPPGRPVPLPAPGIPVPLPAPIR
jgi:Spy/CpxP family protein refolding chaperone